jgi:hypothetical protein
MEVTHSGKEDTHRGAACTQGQTPRVPNSMANTKLKQKQLYFHGASARALTPTAEHLPLRPKHQLRSALVGGSGEGGTKHIVRLGQQFLAAV